MSWRPRAMASIFFPHFLVLLLLQTQAQELCNLEPFIEQNLDGITQCKTCFFPTYPRIKDIKLDAYKTMDFSNQWVYFHGDSTLRQVYGEFYSIIHKTQPMGYAELKHHSRLDCPDQPRDSYVPPPYDKTPCYLNEKTCTSFYNDTGMGQAINITYDWKHLMYEDYDRWLYNRWTKEKEGPTLLFVSPGLHDCYHEPDQYEHHARNLRHLVEHLMTLDQTVVYVDMNPTTRAVDADGHRQDALRCIFYVNDVAHALARKHGMLMFSRQTMIVSGNQKDESGEFPMHQKDETVGEEVKLMLAWLGCILEHKQAGTLTS